MRIPGSFEDVEAEITRFAGAENKERLFAFYRKRFHDADPTRLREKFRSDAIYVAPAIRTAEAHEAPLAPPTSIDLIGRRPFLTRIWGRRILSMRPSFGTSRTPRDFHCRLETPALTNSAPLCPAR
jgi:hypothetical protein